MHTIIILFSGMILRLVLLFYVYAGSFFLYIVFFCNIPKPFLFLLCMFEIKKKKIFHLHINWLNKTLQLFFVQTSTRKRIRTYFPPLHFSSSIKRFLPPSLTLSPETEPNIYYSAIPDVVHITCPNAPFLAPHAAFHRKNEPKKRLNPHFKGYFQQVICVKNVYFPAGQTLFHIT